MASDNDLDGNDKRYISSESIKFNTSINEKMIGIKNESNSYSNAHRNSLFIEARRNEEYLKSSSKDRLPYLIMKREENLLYLNTKKLDLDRSKRINKINHDIFRLKFEKHFLDKKRDENERKRRCYGSLTHESQILMDARSKCQRNRCNRDNSLDIAKFRRSFTAGNARVISPNTANNNLETFRIALGDRVKTFIEDLDQVKRDESLREKAEAKKEQYSKISVLHKFAESYYLKSTLHNFNAKEKWKYAIFKVKQQLCHERMVESRSFVERMYWKRRSTINHDAVMVLVNHKFTQVKRNSLRRGHRLIHPGFGGSAKNSLTKSRRETTMTNKWRPNSMRINEKPPRL